jgi:hypothetical protein
MSNTRKNGAKVRHQEEAERVKIGTIAKDKTLYELLK